MSEDHGVVQVVFLDAMLPHLDAWLSSIGWVRFRVPSGDPEELPTYCLSSSDETFKRITEMRSDDTR